MPPLPKTKRSKSRQRMLTSHYRMAQPSYSTCPRCHSAKLPHRVCPTCGYYNGRDVLHREAVTPEQESG